MTVPFVLASRSPARLATLRAAGIEPQVVVSDVDEDAVLERVRAEHERAGAGAPLPADAVLALAHAKAAEVARDRDALVLGCDSMLEFDAQILGKPRDATEARERWRQMSGGTGVLHTGHWLIDDRDDGSSATLGRTSSTVVEFAHVDEDEIDAYVATGEPLQVAGAFTIDGLGGPYVERISGDHHGVVGLSLPLLRALLREVSIPIHLLRGSS